MCIVALVTFTLAIRYVYSLRRNPSRVMYTPFNALNQLHALNSNPACMIFTFCEHAHNQECQESQEYIQPPKIIMEIQANHFSIQLLVYLYRYLYILFVTSYIFYSPSELYFVSQFSLEIWHLRFLNLSILVGCSIM